MNTDTSRPSHFEDRLLAEILADFDQLTGVQSSQAAGRAARRPARLRRSTPALVAGAAAVALGAAGIAVFGGHGPAGNGTAGHAAAGHGTAGDGTGALASPKIQTAAYVVAHMRSALNANTAVLNVLDHAPDSQTGRPVFDETWSKGHTTRFENLNHQGKRISGYLVTITAHRTVSIAISYRKHTWSTTTYAFGSATSGSAPAPRHVTPTQWAAQLRQQTKAGKLTFVGRATVDGQHAIRLQERSALGLVDLWVSPATYLPIREIDTAPGVSENSDKAIRDDYRWLPATPANLRLVTKAAAIPAGFTQVPAHHGS